MNREATINNEAAVAKPAPSPSVLMPYVPAPASIPPFVPGSPEEEDRYVEAAFRDVLRT